MVCSRGLFVWGGSRVTMCSLGLVRNSALFAGGERLFVLEKRLLRLVRVFFAFTVDLINRGGVISSMLGYVDC